MGTPLLMSFFPKPYHETLPFLSGSYRLRTPFSPFDKKMVFAKDMSIITCIFCIIYLSRDVCFLLGVNSP